MSKEKGNPFKRGNTWTFIYYTKDEYGKYKQHWKGGYKTKSDAEKDLKIYKAKATLGHIMPPEGMTLASYLDRWFELHKKHLQPSSVNSYTTALEKHIKPFFKEKKLKDVKTSDINRFYAWLMEEHHLSPKTVKLVSGPLRTAFKDAVIDKLLPDNPCQYAKLPASEKISYSLISAEEMAKLFAYISHYRYEEEIKLTCLHGLRRGEVLGISEQDVDFKNHTLSIRQQVSTTKVYSSSSEERGVNYGVKKLKSKNSRRTLDMSEISEQLIKQRMASNELKFQDPKFKANYDKYKLIFCAKDGTPENPNYLYRYFKKALKECGLPNMRYHDLRHSYATLCVDLNVPLKVISQMLGHGSIAVTADIYADSIKAKKEVADKVSNAIMNNFETNEEHENQ